MAYNPSNPNGQATMANSAPVVIASNQSAVPISDNSGSITVDGSVTVSGTVTANAGTGTMNVSVQNASIPVTDNGGSLTVDGSVSVSNFPATQAVSGTITANAGSGTFVVGDGGSSLTVDGSVSVSNFPATQVVSATNLDIRDLTSTDVVTVTGGAGQTADVKITLDGEQVSISNFPATQTVSGTVAATQSGTWSTRTQDGSGNAVTSHSAGSSRGIDVSIIDGSGNQITSFGGGTQYSDGTTVATPTGTAALGFDGTNVQVLSTNATGHLNIADGGNSITVDGTVAATQSGTWSSRTQDGSGNNVTSRATGSARPFDVAIVDGSGNQVTSFGGGTQYADGTASATPTGTVAMGTDGTNIYAISTDAAGIVNVTINNASVPISDGGGSITVDGTVDISQPGGGAFNVQISDGTSTVPIDAAHSDAETNTENHIDVGAKGLFFNGSTWDRMRGTVADGLLVNLGTNNDVTITGTVAVTDNGGSLTVDGTVAATQSGTWILGANTGVDIGDVTINNASGASAVNIQDGGNSITVDGTVTVTDGLNIEGDVAHDSVDSGNPVKIGFKAASTLPTGVATGDRVDAVADLYGRQLVTNIDDGMQVWKGANYTTQQTGTDIWTPSAGKRIAITYLAISSYATTAGRVILWLGASGDTTYTAGTDQLVWAGSFAPSANAKPGAIISVPFSIAAVTADHRLKITTDAAISLDLTIYGYEH